MGFLAPRVVPEHLALAQHVVRGHRAAAHEVILGRSGEASHASIRDTIRQRQRRTRHRILRVGLGLESLVRARHEHGGERSGLGAGVNTVRPAIHHVASLGGLGGGFDHGQHNGPVRCRAAAGVFGARRALNGVETVRHDSAAREHEQHENEHNGEREHGNLVFLSFMSSGGERNFSTFGAKLGRLDLCFSSLPFGAEEWAFSLGPTLPELRRAGGCFSFRGESEESRPGGGWSFSISTNTNGVQPKPRLFPSYFSPSVLSVLSYMKYVMIFLISFVSTSFALSPKDVLSDHNIDFNRHSVILDGPIKLVHAALVDRLDDLRRDRLFLLYNSGEINETALQNNLSLYIALTKGPIVRWGRTTPIIQSGFFTILNTGGVQLKYPRLAADFSKDSIDWSLSEYEPTVKRGLTATFRPDASISSRPPFVRQLEFGIVLFYHDRGRKCASITFSYLYRFRDRDSVVLLEGALLSW